MSEILLIEDSRTQALTYQRLLEQHGYLVRHAATTDEALRLCLDATPDLVLLDQYLGEQSGLEVCRRLKADPTLQVIPLVVLTGSQKERDHIAALEAGADRFLSKDSPDDQLLAVVEGLLKSAVPVESLETDDDARDSFLRGARLLAIDDSRTYLAELSNKLTESGFQVTAVTSGKEGLQRLDAESYHIVVIDVVMPEMNGFEVCRHARAWAEKNQKQLGLLILSGRENREVLLQALESGADDFVSKQQDMEVILAHIKSLVRRVRMMRHIQNINQKSHSQELALRESEWQRQQAEERARHAESKAALYEELEKVAVELKKSKSELEVAKEAAEAANQAKSDFLANMSHEIRTPMNGIIGMLTLMSKTALTRQQNDYIGMAQQSAEALLRLLNDILDFSKIEAGKMELEAVGFSLQECLGKAVRLMTLRAQEKGLELACRIDPEIPDRLIGDPGRLRQIVVNLVGNAIKFTERGEVVVNVNPEEVLNGRARLHVAVRDTGVGIPEDKQQRIFEAFSQADTSTTRRFGGTGLGLAISSRLVQMMDGRIWVESEYGHGATFHFISTLGVADEQQPLVRADLFHLKGLPVLVVDDNRTNRRILDELLKAWGLSPTLAADGPTALRQFAQADRSDAPFRLIISDYHMPDMNGLQLAQQIRAIHGDQSCPVLILSSSMHDVSESELEAAGVRRFLHKPVMASELQDALLLALGMTAESVSVSLTDNRPQIAPRRILLAEDSLVNQKVAIGFLTGWGHSVVVASNGRLAVEAVEREPFDLVLMDVQMPDMNGYEATATIRKREHGSDHIPIVAMTAEAMKGDRELCLQAGMDDYISKPFDPQELFRVVAECPARLLSRDGGETAADGRAHAPMADGGDHDDSAVVDWDAAKRSTDGDENMIRELARIVRQQLPQLLEDMRRSVATSDHSLLQRSAHTLKTSASYFGSGRIVDLALQLELLGRQHNSEDAPPLLETLAPKVASLTAALNQQPWCDARPAQTTT